VLANQVTVAARAITCAYSTVASKFVTNYRVDKSKEGSPRSCSIIAAILDLSASHQLRDVFCNFSDALLPVWNIFLSDTSEMLSQHFFDTLVRGLELPFVIKNHRYSVVSPISYSGFMKKFSIMIPFFEPLNSRLFPPKYFLLLAEFLPFLMVFINLLNFVIIKTLCDQCLIEFL